MRLGRSTSPAFPDLIAAALGAGLAWGFAMSDENCPRPEGADEGAVDACAAVGAETASRRYAPYTRFTAAVAREICTRVTAGESQTDICAEDRMPTIHTLRRWARRYGAFGRALARARALGGRQGTGPVSGYDAAIAQEIVARIGEGETMTSIGADPAMPCGRTIYLWRKLHPEFAEDVRVAREVVAERFSDLGWKLAMEATPETAYLTHVRLNQLRWTAALMAPGTHGPMKPTEPPTPRKVQNVLLRHFKLEVHPETGQQRVVGFCPDPRTMQPVRDAEGEWSDPPEVIRARYAKFAGAICTEPPSVPVDPDDPEGWC